MKKAYAWVLTLLTILPLFATAQDFYRGINLVDDFFAQNTDLKLVNPWGFVFTPEGNVVVANNGSSTSTIYTPLGGGLNFNPGTTAPERPTLFINVISKPTGIVINHSKSSFLFGLNSGKRRPALYIYSTEVGTLLAYDKHVDPLNAIVVVDNSSSGAVYKGLEIAKVDGELYLYAPDFHNAKIDIFDSKFKFVKSFTDTTIPAGFAPFNVRRFHDKLFVTYAKQQPPLNVVDQPGPGNGFVDIFTLKGKFIKRLISDGNLNSPWGMAISPKNYGPFSNALIVANNGDGLINAYDLKTGNFLGSLFDETAAPIVVPGIWGLRFGHLNPRRPQLYSTANLGFPDFAGFLSLIQYTGSE